MIQNSIYIYNVWCHDSIQFYDTIHGDYSNQFEREAAGYHPVAWSDGHAQLMN